MAVIAVDVDLTVVDMAPFWWSWLQEQTECDRPYPHFGHIGEIDYDLSNYFKEELEEKGIDGHDYWRQKNIYDGKVPIPGSRETLCRLFLRGHDIIFVSQLKGDHHKSKVEFLKRHFPYMKAFVGTKEKWAVRCDVLIDDRESHLASMPDDVILVKYNTPYTQNVSLRGTGRNFFLCDWSHIDELFRYFGD